MDATARVQLLWAVRIRIRTKGTRRSDQPFLAGRHYFGARSSAPVSTALFHTRREAEEAARSTRGPLWDGANFVRYATPVRVRVSVEPREQP